VSTSYGLSIELSDVKKVSTEVLDKIREAANHHWSFEDWFGTPAYYAYGEESLGGINEPEDIIAEIATDIREIAGFSFEFMVNITYLEEVPTEPVFVDIDYYGRLEYDKAKEPTIEGNELVLPKEEK